MRNPRLKGGFGMVSNTVIRDPDISIRDKAIYAYLATFANNLTNELTVSIDRVAAECGVDQSTVKRSLLSLRKKGIISRISRGVKKTSITILTK